MEELAALGKVAGVAGIALGVLFLVFRDVVAPHIPNLPRKHAYTLLHTITGFSFVIAVAGLGAWLWVETHPKTDLAAQVRENCLRALAEARAKSDDPALRGVISAGGKIAASGDIRVEGADKLDRAAVTADCGDVTAGGKIEIGTSGDGATATEPPN